MLRLGQVPELLVGGAGSGRCNPSVLVCRKDGSLHVTCAGASDLQAQNLPSDPSPGFSSYQGAGDPGALGGPAAGPVHLHHHLLGCR